MGRSQVERNRRLGRPGSKGRGGGGRITTSGGRGGGRGVAEPRHNPASNLRSNEWRYQEETGGGGGVDDDGDGMLTSSYGYAEHGPAHDDIASTLLGGDDAPGSGGGGGGVSLNLDNLARSLRKVPTHDLLNFPPHIAREYDKKYGEFVDEKRAKTISELRVAGAIANTTNKTLGSNADAKLVTTEGPDTSTTTSNEAGGSDKKPVKADAEPESSTVTDGNAGGDGEDAEDLDAWLDSVI